MSEIVDGIVRFVQLGFGVSILAYAIYGFLEPRKATKFAILLLISTLALLPTNTFGLEREGETMEGIKKKPEGVTPSDLAQENEKQLKQRILTMQDRIDRKDKEIEQ